MNINRLGIFGGTFDPIHNGHLKALKVFIKELSLNKVLVIPTAVPPHKDFSQTTDGYKRLEMARLAVENIPEADVSDFEIKNGGKSYTIQTLKHLYLQYPENSLFLFAGSDMFLTLQNWYKSDEIMSIAEIAAFSRSGDDFEKLAAQKDYLVSKYGAVCHLIQFEPYVISSTMLRDMIKKGEDVSEFIPQNVMSYINKYNLYKNNIDFVKPEDTDV